ncbi:trigger factor [Adlercreutzia sp. ZJ473]|uniref:trigger factor n=1 Tax=Adlercreutzia sp. ZJ473 TaxID=2722822 RepID=UPI0015559DB5|nr:trigger factor [Adlercreutzia sp. ZJ473]
MDFTELTRTDSFETGAIEISLAVAAGSVHACLAEFYEVVAPHHGLALDAPWNEVDIAAEARMGQENYRELRRDFVVNQIVSAAVRKLDVTPALTPQISVLDYPRADDAFAFKLSVVERPMLMLTSYEPVEVDPYEEHVTDDMVASRIAGLLETHAAYEEAPAHPVRLGDCIAVDIMTICEGRPVAHMTGSKMYFELEPGFMPDEFMDGVVGMDVGETKVIDYRVPRARGISDDDMDEFSATVTVLSQQTKTVPELTDAWVNANVEKAASVDELYAGVRAGMEAEMTILNRDTLARLANIELEKRLVGKIPDEFYKASGAGQRAKLERELAERGQTIDDYLEAEHMNEEELSVQMLIKSGENLRQGFALEALFDGRDMRLTEEDLRFSCEQAFGAGSYDPEALRRTGRFALVESSAKRMRALNWLADTATVRG